jgi:hypothetical protein
MRRRMYKFPLFFNVNNLFEKHVLMGTASKFDQDLIIITNKKNFKRRCRYLFAESNKYKICHLQ